MLGKDLIKKITIIELEVALAELREKSKEGLEPHLKILTPSGFIEAEIDTELSTKETKETMLSQALINVEFSPKVDLSKTEVINITACLYLKHVIFTPFTTLTSIEMDELILFTDHILGITLL